MIYQKSVLADLLTPFRRFCGWVTMPIVLSCSSRWKVERKSHGILSWASGPTEALKGAFTIFGPVFQKRERRNLVCHPSVEERSESLATIWCVNSRNYPTVTAERPPNHRF